MTSFPTITITDNSSGKPIRKTVDIQSDEEKVVAKVCQDKTCQETVLYQYQGSQKKSRAQATARNLHRVISSGDLFEGSLELNYWKNKMRVDNSWLPFNTTTLLDLSSLDYPVSIPLEFVRFINNLWASGIMPTETQKAKKQIKKLSRQIKWRWFRDPRLEGLHKLSGLNLQVKNYKEAEKLAREILNHKYTVTAARPVFYDEAVFLLADLRRLQAMRYLATDRLNQAFALLSKNIRNLKSLENGYKTRYNYEFLKTCQIYAQIFRQTTTDKTLEERCQPQKIAQYRENATLLYNRLSPAFADNFLAIRSYLAEADYRLSSKDPRELEKAGQEYERVLKLIHFFDDPFSVVDGDLNENWSLFSPLMHKNDRFIGRHFGIRRGLWSYALRSKLSKSIRKHVTSQFDRKLFNLFEAKALWGLARIQKKLAKLNPQKARQHSVQAIAYFRQAHTKSRFIKQEKVTDFYTSSMFEERYMYNNMAVDYAETLMDFYYEALKASSPAARVYLSRALALVKEAYAQRVDDPADTTYLKTLLLLGNIYEQRAYTQHGIQDFARAFKHYRTIVKNLRAEEKKVTKGKTLAPYYRYLKGMAMVKGAAAFMAWPTKKSPEQIREQIENVKEGTHVLLALNALTAKEKDKLKTSSRLLIADLNLALADRSPLEKETATQIAWNIFTSLPQDSPFYHEAKAKQLEIIIRRAEFVEKDAQGNKLVAKATRFIDEYEGVLLKLKPQSYEWAKLAASLSVLYVYRNKAEKGDADRVIKLSHQILAVAQKLNPYTCAYLQTYARLHKGIAKIQKAMAERKTIPVREADEAFTQIEKELPRLEKYSAALAWDMHNLKAELYHRMAIAYSIREATPLPYGLPKRLGLSRTYLYTQLAYRECLLSSSKFDREARPALIAQNLKIESAYGTQAYPTHVRDAAHMKPGELRYGPDYRATQTWQQWKSNFIITLDKGALVRDRDPNSEASRTWIYSERSGYGLYLALRYGDIHIAKRLLEGMENYAKNQNGLYAWQLDNNGAQKETRSATDADLYIAYAAVKTKHERAQAIIDALWNNAIVERGGKLILKPSDHHWPEWGDGQVVYNPSYFAPHLLKTLAAFDKNKKHDWQKVINDGYELLNEIMANSRRLGARGQNPIPNWVLCKVTNVKDRHGKITGNRFSLDPYKVKATAAEMDAIRVLLEIGRDAIINKDPRAVEFLKKLVRAARVTNTRSVRIQGYNNELAIALYGVALKGAGRDYQDFLHRLDSSFRTNHFGFRADGTDRLQYYKQSLILMARMLLRGKE